MIPSSLQSDLEKIYSNSDRTPSQAADLYATAIVRLWESAITPGGGSVRASHVKSAIVQGVNSAFSATPPSSIPAAQVIATTLNAALLASIPSGGTFGAGAITPLGLALLISDLSRIYGGLTDNPAEAAQKEAQAIVNFSKATLCIGSGVEAPTPIPKIGPLK